MPGWALKREIFPQENGPLGWGLPAPVVGVSVFGLAAVERPNQIELLVFDIGQAIKAGAAGGDFFAGVGVGLNPRHAKKALVFGGDVFAKTGVVLLCGFTHQPHVFGGLFIAVLSPCRVQRQGRSQKYPTPICDHFSAHLKSRRTLFYARTRRWQIFFWLNSRGNGMKKI
jgi:hypothetical protein